MVKAATRLPTIVWVNRIASSASLCFKNSSRDLAK